VPQFEEGIAAALAGTTGIVIFTISRSGLAARLGRQSGGGQAEEGDS
jgi:hypothetical protein